MSDLLLFSGTQDGRELLTELLARGYSVLLSVATAYAVPLQPEAAGLTVRQGRLTREEMEALIRQERPRAVIDATHPYAQIVSTELKAAAEASATPYLRLLRAPSQLPAETELVADVREAVARLKTMPGRILLTTGSKDLLEFAAVGAERLYPRVLPTEASRQACRDAGIPEEQIIAAQGPFSYEENRRQIAQYGIEILVSKDGGPTGGCPEKLAAAVDSGCRIVVIARPEETGHTAEEIIAWAEKELSI